MFPGLMRSPWIPASSAAIAYFHWKWMSATTGTVDFAAIATSDAICWSVALISAVLVVVIDWTETGCSLPIGMRPSWICRVGRRGSIIALPVYGGPRSSLPEDLERDRPVLRLVELEEDEPLPRAERRLAGHHGDRVRRGGQEHRLHVRVAVLPLVGMEVLRPDREVVVGVVDALVRHEVRQVASEVLQRAVLP